MWLITEQNTHAVKKTSVNIKHTLVEKPVDKEYFKADGYLKNIHV